MALTRAQIQTAFQNSLGRAASTSEENSFFSVSQSGALSDAQVISTISNGQEANLNADPVVRFYQAAFGRVPDQAGLDNATDYVRSFGATAQTYQNLANQFVVSQEFTNRFGAGAATAPVDAAYIQALYSTILGRTASAAEVNAYTSGSNGFGTRGSALYAISQSQEAIGISDNAVNGFLANAAQGTAVYTGTLYTAANGQPNPPSSTGQTFTLTANVDGPNAVAPGVNTNGTAGNDTYLGTEATVQSSDIINGGEGTDTLSIRVTATGSTSAPQLNSVENVVVSNITGGGGTFVFNAASSTGLTTVGTLDSVANTRTDFTNVAAGTTLRVDNGDGRTDFNVAGAGGRTGTADAVSLQIANGSGTAGTPAVVNLTDGAGAADATFENFNITTSGAASTVNVGLGGANARVINVSGTGGLTLTENAGFANVTTVNAAGLTAGGLDISLVGSTQNVTFTGSGQNDAVRLGGSLTTADVLNGGVGTDTIGITAGATLVNGLQVTGFEVLDVGGANATGAAALANNFDVSKLAGITTLAVSTAINADAGTNDVVTINNLAKGAGVVIGASIGTGAGDILAINVQDAGAGSPNDTIAVTLAGPAAVTTGGELTINDIETVSINSQSTGQNVTHVLSTLNVAQATTVNVAATTAGLTITNINDLGLVRFDASASTQAVSVTTGADAFTTAGGTAFILGQGNDTLVLTGATNAVAATDFVITGGRGGDAITLSAAGQVEVLKFAAGDSLAGVTGGANNFDTIANFATGEDKIDLTSFGFTGTSVASVRTNAAAGVTAATGEVAAAQAANFFGAGADQRAVATVTQGGDTFVYVDANKDGSFQAGTDLAIKLTATAAPALADFTFA